VSVVAATLVAVVFMVLPSCDKKPAKPNVLVICVDSLRPDFMGVYGSQGKASSLMDNIARKGVHFTNAYTTAPWVLPAVASLMTGLYPSEHGVIEESTVIDSKSATLPELMQKGGYKTAGISPHHLLGKERGFGRGFDNYYHLVGATSEEVVKRALQWLDANAENPTFLFCHLMDTHAPYRPPAHLVSRYYPPGVRPMKGGMAEMLSIMEHWPAPEAAQALEAVKALYMAEIERSDRALEKLIRFLQKKRLDRNTMIVIVSDNGEEFMEHGLMNHGFSLHEQQIRIPMIFSWPGKISAGVLINDYVSLVDLMPTILSFAGLEIPDKLNGSSLRSILKNGKDEALDSAINDRAIFIETTRRGPDQMAVIKDAVKYIESPDFNINGSEMGARLYDLKSDPLERYDLKNDLPEKVADFQRILEDSGLFQRRNLWSVRYAGTRSATIYSGILSTPGRFETVFKDSTRFVSRGAGNVLAKDFILVRGERKIRFASSGKLGKNGIHFIVEPEGALVQATLLVNGKPAPDKIALGYRGVNPKKIPFVLNENGDLPGKFPLTGYWVSSRKVFTSKASVAGYETGDSILPTLDVLRGVRKSMDISEIDELQDFNKYFTGEKAPTQSEGNIQ